jgi:hypothetical protein
MTTRHEITAKRPPKAPAKKQARTPARPLEPRYELVFESKTVGKGALPALLARLESLGARGGSALGDAYARVASSLLVRKERLEDLNAERRFRRRAKAARAAGSPPQEQAVSQQAVASTRKVSG